MLTRRVFSAIVLPAGPGADGAGLPRPHRPCGRRTAKDARVLVVVQLDGGNDALNTRRPARRPRRTQKLRPKLKIADEGRWSS